MATFYILIYVKIELVNEFEIINIIKNQIGSEYIGDDCAYLKDLDIVITQDSLIENIHFKRDWYSPYQLGYKSVAVNISDVLASGAEPLYVTISLSLPDNLDNEFIKDFYQGAKRAFKNLKIVGGDITGSKSDIFISIAAIGITKGRNISSRKYARKGYIIITKGNHGSSALGLQKLQQNEYDEELIKAHLEPHLEYEFSKAISTTVKEKYAMMDTSDGIADALFKIAKASNVSLIVDYNKIPHIKNINKREVLFGGEDYKLVAVIPKKYFKSIPDAVMIGYVEQFNDFYIDISGDRYHNYSELKVFNHFGDT